MAGTQQGTAAPTIPLASTALAFTGFCPIPQGQQNKSLFSRIRTANWLGVQQVALADVEGNLLMGLKEGVVPGEIKSAAGAETEESYFPFTPTGKHATPNIGLESGALPYTGFCKIPPSQQGKGMFTGIRTPWAGLVSVTLADDEVAELMVPIKDDGRVPHEIRQQAGKAPAPGATIVGEIYVPYNPGGGE